MNIFNNILQMVKAASIQDALVRGYDSKQLKFGLLTNSKPWSHSTHCLSRMAMGHA